MNTLAAMICRHRSVITRAALVGLLISGQVQASGDDSPKTPTCPKGQAWDSKSKSCVSQQSGLTDLDLTRYAYALAKARRYDEALGVLDLLHNPHTAEALNYRGYATRKLGRTEEGIGYYLQAVALAPDYSLVREYLGEAYVIQGKMNEAREQLRVIQTLCGRDCEEYQDLAHAINHATPL